MVHAQHCILLMEVDSHRKAAAATASGKFKDEIILTSSLVSDGAVDVLLKKRSLALKNGIPILGVLRYGMGVAAVFEKGDSCDDLSYANRPSNLPPFASYVREWEQLLFSKEGILVIIYPMLNRPSNLPPVVGYDIRRSSGIDDEVVQDQTQRDDYDLQDERQDQPKEEEVEPLTDSRLFPPVVLKR
ncbi:hypothetical protein Tco_0923277 [Tanacetum coccineum]|uniref:Uncharacterized protein n=1 Tax=Tanacetum coccineum TaxID=301880 RepID=A0ABQ5D1J1_9ASTR